MKKGEIINICEEGEMRKTSHGGTENHKGGHREKNKVEEIHSNTVAACTRVLNCTTEFWCQALSAIRETLLLHSGVWHRRFTYPKLAVII